MVDVDMLRQSITDLTDKDGYVVLMAKVEELQNQLRQVKVKDAEGNILLDAEGNERNHAMNDAELYGTYLQKLGVNGNPTFYRLKELFSGDPTGNYASLMSMMNNYCKNPETWDSYRSYLSHRNGRQYTIIRVLRSQCCYFILILRSHHWSLCR
jgi:hypothetical protein